MEGCRSHPSAIVEDDIARIGVAEEGAVNIPVGTIR